MHRVYHRVGGRKVFAQYVAALLLTVMAFALRADFWEYALAIAGVLGITVGSLAYEDVQRLRSGTGRALADDGEASPGYRRPEGWSPEPLGEVDEPC